VPRVCCDNSSVIWDTLSFHRPWSLDPVIAHVCSLLSVFFVPSLIISSKRTSRFQEVMDHSPAEVHAPPTEATFIRAPVNSARDALLNRSRSSTHSWVQPQSTVPSEPPQEPPPSPPDRLAATASPPLRRTNHRSRPLPATPLHPTNPDSPSEEEEAMNIQAIPPPGMIGNPSGTTLPYSDGKVRKHSPRLGWGFVGRLRRIPKSVLGLGKGPTRKMSSDGTTATLPAYTSQPATPLASQFVPQQLQDGQRPPTRVQEVDERSSVPDPLRPGVMHTHRAPSFHVTPPTDATASPNRPYRSPVASPPPPEPIPQPYAQPFPQYDSTYTQEPTAIAVPSSRTPTLRPDGASRRSHLSPPSSAHASLPMEHPISVSGRSDHRPESVQAHPQPADDYLRMHNPDAHSYSFSQHHRSHSHHSHSHHSHHSVTRPLSPPHSPSPQRPVSEFSYTSQTPTSQLASPSFSSDLNPPNPVFQFFSTLYHMPWVAKGRVTEDYRPGMSRGRWRWKRVSLVVSRGGTVRVARTGAHARSSFSHRDSLSVDGGGGGERGRRAKGKILLPIRKPLSSWYTARGRTSSANRSLTTKGLPLGHSWEGKSIQREDVLDLMSSGTGTSVTSGTFSLRGGGMESPTMSPVFRSTPGRRPFSSTSMSGGGLGRVGFHVSTTHRRRERERRSSGHHATSTPLMRQRDLQLIGSADAVRGLRLDDSGDRSRSGRRHPHHSHHRQRQDSDQHRRHRHRHRTDHHSPTLTSPGPAFSPPVPFALPAAASPYVTYAQNSPQLQSASPQIPFVVPYIIPHPPPGSSSPPLSANGEAVPPAAAGVGVSNGMAATGYNGGAIGVGGGYMYMPFIPAQTYGVIPGSPNMDPNLHTPPGVAGRGVPV
jgi:hypothetical protein